jgi:hypothetical protein
VLGGFSQGSSVGARFCRRVAAGWRLAPYEPDDEADPCPDNTVHGSRTDSTFKSGVISAQLMSGTGSGTDHNSSSHTYERPEEDRVTTCPAPLLLRRLRSGLEG